MCQVDRGVFELVGVAGAEGVTRVRAVADLDLLSASAGYVQLLTMWRNGPPDGRLVVELDAGCFVDVRGLRMLLEIGRMLRSRGGAMVLVSSSRTVARVLAILDADGELVGELSPAASSAVRPDAGPGREKEEPGT